MVSYKPGDILEDKVYSQYSLIVESPENNGRNYLVLDLVLSNRPNPAMFMIAQTPYECITSLLDDSSKFEKAGHVDRDSEFLKENWANLVRTNMAVQSYLRATCVYMPINKRH